MTSTTNQQQAIRDILLRLQDKVSVIIGLALELQESAPGKPRGALKRNETQYEMVPSIGVREFYRD